MLTIESFTQPGTVYSFTAEDVAHAARFWGADDHGALLALRDEEDARADEDFEPEYDGQPDEMQEWHDFDPDC